MQLVKIDRLSGRRVFEGVATDDPKAEIIWEAFKPQTEPQRASRQELLAARRNELLAQIKRGVAANGGDAGPQREDLPDDVPGAKGGIY